MTEITADIKKIQDVLKDELFIPNYQRAYRWTETNVRQLLEDILQSWKDGKSAYRVGSVILNNQGKQLNIVDGQQRITTLLLIFKSLNSKIGESLRSSLKYKHVDSKNAIISNKRFIDSWIHESLGKESEGFEKYILEHCEFVEICVNNLSEAFQMFDSQNGRGKELEAYNLLKAYHIRAMESNSFEEKISCDKTWENAARYQSDKNSSQITDLLSQLINEQLFRTRLWSRKEKALGFDKKQINEFKGITINRNQQIDFPYQNRELLHYVTQNHINSLGLPVNGLKSRFKKMSPENVNPFSLINQNIINGKDFFDYTETYVEIYKRLFQFEYHDLKWLKEFVNSHCLYAGSHRDGDKYLFELYKSLIMLLFDKFGEEGVERYYKTLYLLVYRLRIEKEQVRYASVAEHPIRYELFSTIENARTYTDLVSLERLAFQEVECKKDVEPVIRFFLKKGIELRSVDMKKVDLTKYNAS